MATCTNCSSDNTKRVNPPAGTKFYCQKCNTYFEEVPADTKAPAKKRGRPKKVVEETQPDTNEISAEV